MQKIPIPKVNGAESHFLHLYKVVREREPYLTNEAKIIQYGALLRYFIKFLQTGEPYSSQVKSILYWTDLRLGEIYCTEAIETQDNNRYFLAIEYYNQALSYASLIEEQNRVLLALKDIYYYLDDEDALVKLENAWAENHCPEEKFFIYLRLAQNTENPYIKVEFLTKALDFVMYQDKNFYAKYQDTLDVCSQLTVLCELLGEKNKVARFKKLREKTLNLLN